MAEIRSWKNENPDELIEFWDKIFDYQKIGYNPAYVREMLRQADKDNILIIEEDGKMVSCLALWPYEFYINGVILKGAEVGGVATDEKYRRRGYMNCLMNGAIKKMQSEGYDISSLGGYRDRYARWGYELGGMQYNYSIDKRSIKAVDADKEVNLLPYDCSSSLLNKIIKAHKNLPIRTIRSKERYKLTYDFLKLNTMEVWTAETRNEGFAYLVIQRPKQEKNLSVLEYGGTPQIFELAMKQFFTKWELESISIVSPGLYTSFTPIFNKISNGWSISSCRMWRIVNFKSCLAKIIDIQAKKITNFDVKTPFSITLKVKEPGKSSTIVFDKECCLTDKPGDEEVVLTQCEMAKLLFGIDKPSNVFGLRDKKIIYLDLLFPLPIYEWSLDRR